MERIAVISDIHGNMPALEAVLKDIRRRRIKRIVCLGDLAGKGPQPAEAVDRIRAVCELAVQGNWDVDVTLPQTKEAVLWQQDKLGPERLDYLRTLPFSIDLQLSGKWIRLFHASAESVHTRVTRKASKKEKLALFEHTGMTGAGAPEPSEAAARLPDIVVYGDIHVPYMQVIKSKGKRQGLLLYNVGSVGAPYDGIPQASYGILEGAAGGSGSEPYSIQLVRVPYDVEKVIEIAEQEQMPGIERFRYEMRTGLEL